MSKPNDLALAIDRTEGRSDTDTAAKTLLVFKEIQAAIVEMTIHEFMQYSRETIVKQTEFDYFKSRHRSTSNDDRIFGLDSVQKELDSGTIAMDLIYPILYPDKEGGVLVNVEVQRANVSTDGFCRKVIYVSGLIRNQKARPIPEQTILTFGNRMVFGFIPIRPKIAKIPITTSI